MPKQSMPLFARSMLCILLSGCAAGCIRTAVEGGLSPRHFHFHDVVTKKDDNEPGGWRAACLEVGIERNNTGELFYCKFGIEMPIKNARQGEIPIDRAQSIAASSANQAAKTTLSTVTPTTPIGIACEEFKTLYHLTLKNIIDGARVTKRCREGIPPVRLTPPRP
ncbi:hypothetical protein F0U61_43415 [Archangium violaceum]|uniref:hypothetical protein n=1 Tax=Archangium violaceum TaxID=83451 RepID=UPI002B3197E8|nr:hypothetical protein F0U61_43415 [Archangium violaceum]